MMDTQTQDYAARLEIDYADRLDGSPASSG